MTHRIEPPQPSSAPRAAGIAAGAMPGFLRRAAAATPFTFQASWINDAEFTGYFVAIDQGYYTAEGLDLTYLSGGPDVIPESTLIAGKADLTLTTPDTTVKAIVDQGAHVQDHRHAVPEEPDRHRQPRQERRSRRRPSWSARRSPCRRSTSSRSRRC